MILDETWCGFIVGIFHNKSHHFLQFSHGNGGRLSYRRNGDESLAVHFLYDYRCRFLVSSQA